MLFLVNGVVEGGVAVILHFKPMRLIDQKSKHPIDPDGRFMADIAAPLMFAFSLASILMYWLPDDGNDAKHIFAGSWFTYHLARAIAYVKMVILQDKADKIFPLAFHFVMAISFGSYLMMHRLYN